MSIRAALGDVAAWDQYAAGVAEALGELAGRAAADPRCTCIGCPVKLSRLIEHYWQDALWLNERRWQPCPGCEGCGCRNWADAEDLLCSSCRAAEGISRHAPGLAERFTGILRAAYRPGELP